MSVLRTMLACLISSADPVLDLASVLGKGCTNVVCSLGNKQNYSTF